MNQSSISVAPRQDDPPYQAGEPAALFIPCYIDQFFPNIAKATAKLLKRYGVPVVYPEQQTCCGQPAFNSGYWEEARRVIRHFCEVFEPHRWIVCPSGSCAAMCRVFFQQADPDPRIVAVGRRVFELTEFIHDILGVTDTGATFPHKCTLHIGCHGRRELGQAGPPQKLFESVRGMTYCPLPDVEECCGFGGTFSVKLPDVSLAMGEKKVANIVRSGADVVVSNDISCLMHIGGIMQRKPETKHIRVMHIAEVLVSGWEEE
ncbi:MAG: (Fe-S)-binding protein [Pirellulales bacterium]|nr:(Fe-S)-binding protein [Pirellulales bacterium]